MSSSFFWECVAIAILFFLFDGDPDVYDKLKEAAMHIGECK